MSPPCTAERRHGALLHRRRRRRANRDRHGARGRRNRRRRVRRSDDCAVLIAAEVPTATASAPRKTRASDSHCEPPPQRSARPTSPHIRIEGTAKSDGLRSSDDPNAHHDAARDGTHAKQSRRRAPRILRTDSANSRGNELLVRPQQTYELGSAPRASTAIGRRPELRRQRIQNRIPQPAQRSSAKRQLPPLTVRIAGSERRARALRGLDASNLHPIAHAHTDSWHRTTPLPAPTDRPRRLRRPDSTTS